MISKFNEFNEVSDEITIDNYFINSKGNFQEMSTESLKELIDSYLEWKEQKSSIHIECGNITYLFNFESVTRNRNGVKNYSYYFQILGEDSIVRISDHWSESKYSGEKLNCGFIKQCYWTILNGDIIQYFLPKEKKKISLIGGKILFKDLEYNILT